MILPKCASAATVILFITFPNLCVSNDAPALEYENVVEENGYHFKYKTLDSERDEKGFIEPGKSEEEGSLKVEGHYNFVAPDGKLYEVMYVSDENGFRPKVSLGGATAIKVSAGGFSAPLLASLAGGGLGK